MMAIEQFTELEERHTFLTTQRADLLQSIQQTGEAIKRIEQTTRERFHEAFGTINEYFGTTFSTLFGGGRAGLVLLDDQDELESGIDIIAQPPGKRLQSVQLLSGGEKALTAMALMFALFRYRPSPFCLLDEIDAPLDDANIGALRRDAARHAGPDAVHPHHAPSQDDGDRRSPLRRDDGRARRLEADFPAVALDVRGGGRDAAPTARMPNETRATRYHRARLQAGAGAFLASLLVLRGVRALGAGPCLAALLHRARSAAGRLATGWRPRSSPPIVLGVAHAARYPFDRHREWTLEGRYGLARLSAGRWTRAHLRGIAARITLGRRGGAARWPRPGAGPARLVARHRDRLLPRRIWPGRWRRRCCSAAFGGLRPLRRPSLAARLDALVRRCGVDVAVREWRGGDETTQAHAALAGLGRTRQILLSDTLVDTLRDEEIEVVVAHEIGHHVHGDVWRAAAWRLVALPLTIGAAALALAWLGAPARRVAVRARDRRARGRAARRRCRGCRCSPRRRSSRTACSSRSGWRCRAGRELRADAYAVRLTGGADAFVTSMRRLSQTNLVDDQPPRLARVLSSHPPVRDRVLAALRSGAARAATAASLTASLGDRRPTRDQQQRHAGDRRADPERRRRVLEDHAMPAGRQRRRRGRRSWRARSATGVPSTVARQPGNHVSDSTSRRRPGASVSIATRSCS